jgi:hypothetical protein
MLLPLKFAFLKRTPRAPQSPSILKSSAGSEMSDIDVDSLWVVGIIENRQGHTS